MADDAPDEVPDDRADEAPDEAPDALDVARVLPVVWAAPEGEVPAAADVAAALVTVGSEEAGVTWIWPSEY